ncbi:DNA topoisomerase [Serratia ureilytica]
MSANQVLSIAQSLYETHKATTYPRTDCGYLPTSMREEVADVLSAVTRTDPTLNESVAKLDRTFVSRIWNDKNHGAPWDYPNQTAVRPEQAVCRRAQGLSADTSALPGTVPAVT